VAALVLAACSAGGGASPTTVPAETTPAVDVPATDAPTTTSPAEELPALDDVTAPAWKPTTRTEELEVTIPLIDLRLVSFNVDKADMDTLGPTQSDDPTRGIVCRIRVFPLLWKAQNDDETLKTAFAHELFHCFQGWWNPIGGFPAWLTEGSASFAAFDLYRSSFDPPARYNTPSSRPR